MKKASVTSADNALLHIKKSIFLLGGCFFIFLHVQAQTADAKILLDLQEDRSAPLTPLYKDISKTTSYISVGIPISLLVTGMATHNADMKKKALFMGETFIVNTVLTTALKYTIRRDRPFVKDPSIIPLDAAGGYSFPSGHTSDAFSTATALSMAYPKWYIIAPSYLWAGSVAYSRMYLGVHYPSDVVAGAIVGAGSAFLTKKLTCWIQKKHTAHVNEKLLN